MTENLFITGCDRNTEWQLPWFWENYSEYNDTPLLFVDFGVSEGTKEWVKYHIGESMLLPEQEYNVTAQEMNKKSWFKKPAAMESSCGRAKKVCWLDTDCQVFGDISGIFDLTVPNKICMVEDRPWTKRRGEYGTWFNSGVVCWEGRPTILSAWKEMCITQGWHGDQETLYAMMGGDEIMKMSIIEPLPHKYNTLRLDYTDKIAVKNPLIVHHTGDKGNKVIKEQINNVQ